MKDLTPPAALYLRATPNCRRRHSTIGYLSPVDFETAALKANMAA